MKRFFSLILCLTLLCSLGGFLVSCEKDEPETSTLSEAESTILPEPETTVAAAVEDKSIALSELGNYVIIRNDDGYLNEAAARDLKKFLDETFSLDMTLKSDFVTDAVPGYEEAEFEIVVGVCDREESAEFIADLGYYDYGYAIIGNKLVISGAGEAGTYKAVEHFIENVAKKCEGEKFYDNIAQNYLFSDDYAELSIDGTPINEYSIVYPRSKKKSEDHVAKLVLEVIRDLSGYTLELKTDAAEATGKEILIGETSRGTVPTLAEGEYFVGKSGDDILLYANNSAGLLDAYNAFISMLEETPALTLGDTVKAAEFSDEIVVLDYNVWMHTAGQESRVNAVLQAIEEMNPDLMGLQECTHEWMAFLTDKFSAEYGIIGEGRDGTHTSEDQFNPVLYRKDKFTLIESGTRWLSETPEIKYSKVPKSSYERIFTYAILEEKASGKQFVFISTHFDHEGGQADQASAMIAYISQFRDMPMFMCGDYNGSGVESIMINHGYVSSKNVALDRVNDIPTMEGGNEIDFIFTNGRDVGITYYKVLSEQTNSDHFPVLVKFKFEK